MPPAKKSKKSKSNSKSSNVEKEEKVELTLHRCGFVDWAPSEISSIAYNDNDLVAVLRGKGKSFTKIKNHTIYVYLCVYVRERERES